MRKNITFLFVMSGLVFMSLSSFAQMDNLANMSAEWMRWTVRNAATDAVDAAVYNPAGLVKLPDGFQFNLANQMLFRKPQHTYDFGFGNGEQSFKQDGSDPFLPNLYAVYKKDKWALYGGVYISGGGATANYPHGSISTELIALQVLFSPSNYVMLPDSTFTQVYTNTKDHSLKASSYYLTYMLGGAYAVNSKLSFSLGLRYLSGINKVKAGLTLTGGEALGQADQALKVNYEDRASGIGGIIGVNYQVCEKMNLSVHYETAVKLDFKSKVNNDDLGVAVDGAKNRRDLPSVLYLGAGCQVTPKLKTLIDFNYYFQKSADWGNDTIPNATGYEVKKWSELAGNCYTYGIGFGYMVCPKCEFSIGGVYTKFLFKDKVEYYTRLGEFEAPKSDNFNLGLGIGYEFLPKMKLNLALGSTFWKKYDIIAKNAEMLQAINPLIDPTVQMKISAYTITFGLNIGL